MRPKLLIEIMPIGRLHCQPSLALPLPLLSESSLSALDDSSELSLEFSPLFEVEVLLSSSLAS
jgi:hypothetical protein